MIAQLLDSARLCESVIWKIKDTVPENQFGNGIDSTLDTAVDVEAELVPVVAGRGEAVEAAEGTALWAVLTMGFDVLAAAFDVLALLPAAADPLGLLAAAAGVAGREAGEGAGLGTAALEIDVEGEADVLAAACAWAACSFSRRFRRI